MEKILRLLSLALSDLFLVSLFLYLAAVRIDLSFDGIISRAFNLNILFITCVIAGVVAIVIPRDTDEGSDETPPRRLWAYIIVLSVMVGSIVTKILEPLSLWAPLIGIAAAAIVFFANFVMIREYEND